jgi:hypothetical protein
MPKTDDKQKRQDLGIFYTPPPVANFIFEILTIWKNREDKESARWQSHKPRPHFPSVVDPAVGEGVFLKTAVEKGFTGPDWIFGLDIDENAVRKWKEINMLKQFGGREKDLGAHFFHQNGLEPIKWEQHTGTYRYKLKQDDIKKQQFDAVVGNPPYGGLGVDLKNKKNPEAIALLNALVKYEVFWWKKAKQNNGQNKTDGPLSLFENFAHTESKNHYLGITEVTKIAEGIPIEILFTERFLQLAKPGGWVVIIIPDGILTNSNAHYVREFLANRVKIEAITSLPRGTFKHAGTSAKTSILFLRKYRQDEKPHYNYPVFLSSVAGADEESFKKVVKEYEKVYNSYNNPMNKSNHNNPIRKDELSNGAGQVVIIKDESGKEAVMVRVDKTLKEMMEEKPFSRWDPKYWHVKYDDLFSTLKIEKLRNYIRDIQGGGGGSHFSAFLGDKWDEKGKFATYLHISALMNTGLNWVDAKYINEKTYNRLKTKQLQENDILLSNKGTVGKSVVVPRKFLKTVVGDTRVIRVERINPYYVCVYFKSFFGQALSERYKSGVASEGTTVDQLYEFYISLIDEMVQTNIESEYKKMSAFHDKAMEAKKKGDETGYQKNIKTAEAMLRDLIVRTEAVIRGEREDVI